MEFFPFFLECSKHQTDEHKKKTLEALAFGSTDLIMSRGNAKVLVTSKGEFVIPTQYTETLRLKLDEFMWNSTDGYYKMQEDIKKSYNSWINVKKKDKLRMIDRYVLDKCASFSEVLILKSLITIALMLKLINIENITYENGKILDVDEELAKNRLNTLETPLNFPSSIKSKLRNAWIKWLKSNSDVESTIDRRSVIDDSDSVGD